MQDELDMWQGDYQEGTGKKAKKFVANEM